MHACTRWGVGGLDVLCASVVGSMRVQSYPIRLDTCLCRRLLLRPCQMMVLLTCARARAAHTSSLQVIAIEAVLKEAPVSRPDLAQLLRRVQVGTPGAPGRLLACLSAFLPCLAMRG